MAEQLLPQQLVSRIDYLEAQQNWERLQTELAAIGPATARARSALNESLFPPGSLVAGGTGGTKLAHGFAHGFANLNIILRDGGRMNFVSRPP